MKTSITVIVIAISSVLAAQNVEFTPTEVQNLYHNIAVLQQRDTLKTQLIGELQSQIMEYRNVVKSDSIINAMRTQQIEIQQQQINLYRTAYEQNKRRWWEKPWIWFVAGSLTTTALTITLTR